MAQIKLSRYEAEEALPAVCMRCGAPADQWTAKKFSWYPPWVAVLLFAGVVPHVIVALILTRRMTVRAPFCREHKNHWRWRTAVIVLSLVAMIVVGIGALVLAANLDKPGRQNDDIVGMVCGGTALAGVAWVIVAVILQQTSIRATEITDRSITLVQVAADFADIVREDRERWEEEEEDWPRRRRRTTSDEFYDPGARRPRRSPRDEDEDQR